MANQKFGEKTRNEVITHILEALESSDYDVLQVGSASYAIPFVEDGEDGGIRIIIQLPKGARDGEGYDPFEEAQAYQFHCEEAEIKRKKKAEDKAKKIAKTKKEKGE